MRCATCDQDNGCQHIQKATDVELLQKHLIEVSEAAAGITPRSVQVSPENVEYVPGNRDVRTPPKAGESRGPSVVFGARGPEGPQGKPGPEGKPGKDADVSDVVELARAAMEEVLALFAENVPSLILNCLQRAGAIDENGKAIFVAGKDGRDGVGRDGVDGKDGLGIPGPRGEAGKDGESIVGPKGDTIVGPRGEKGEKGEKGDTIVGPQGSAGKDGEFSQSEIANLEVRFRNIWKNDIQAALRVIRDSATSEPSLLRGVRKDFA